MAGKRITFLSLAAGCGHNMAEVAGDQSRSVAFVKRSTEFLMPPPFKTRPTPSSAAFNTARSLTEKDAVEIWIARWLRVRPKVLITRYACDPRRIYEIWEGARYPHARAKALAEFSTRYPQLAGHVDCSPHKRLPLRTRSPDQLSLFG
jgi:hypothetical protein